MKQAIKTAKPKKNKRAQPEKRAAGTFFPGGSANAYNHCEPIPIGIFNVIGDIAVKAVKKQKAI